MWRHQKQICPQGLCIPDEDNKHVPLKDIKVVASIQGFVCKVTSILHYENVEDKAIEAVFVFPMDADCAVYQFEAEIDNRKIVAECQDSEEARQTYDDAVNQGYTSVLLGQDRNSADVFKCSVGNLPALKAATIRFSYVKELPLTLDGGVDFVLPTILNPRYNPEVQDGGVTDSKLGDAVSVPLNAVPYSFLFEATVASDKQILNVTSFNSDVQTTIADGKTSAVLLLRKNFKPDHDLSFVVYFDKIYEPSAIFAEGDDKASGMLKNNVLMLNFLPELDESELQGEKEFIFVMDRSGSMGGARMISAKETLLLFLKSLPADCYFNIVSFGSTHQFLFRNGSQKYSDDSLKEACDLQSFMEADFGGTEILRPLEDIYQRPAIDGYPRQCFVLTDGEVGNVNTVISLVKKNVDKARIFTFGIGEGASTALVKGLARAGQGKAIFVKDEERLQPKVMKILKCAMQTGVKGIKVDIQGSPDAKVLPQPVPPLYSGDRLVLYAILGQSAPQHGVATLSGTVGDQTLQFAVPLSSARLSSASDDMAIHRLAAKSQIAQLEGSEIEQESNAAEKGSAKAMIVLLSTSANIVSKYTSMVGVDTEQQAGSTAPPKTRRIPTPSFRGQFGGGPPMRMMAAKSSTCKPMSAPGKQILSCDAFIPMSIPASIPDHAKPLRLQMAQALCSAQKKENKKKKPASGLPCDDEERKAPEPVGYMSLVKLQSFSGEWRLDEELAAVFGKSLEELKKSGAQVDEKVWATALALSLLRNKFKAEHDEWEMVEMKALQWLAKSQVNTKDVLAKAMKIIN